MCNFAAITTKYIHFLKIGLILSHVLFLLNLDQSLAYLYLFYGKTSLCDRYFCEKCEIMWLQHRYFSIDNKLKLAYLRNKSTLEKLKMIVSIAHTILNMSA